MTNLLPILEDYRARSAAAIDSIPVEQVAALINDLIAVREAGGRVFCIGNGGSQANVQHLVLHLREHGIFAIDLLADNAAVTALANDVDYDEAAAILLTRFSPHRFDMSLAITGSGGSLNVATVMEDNRVGYRWSIHGMVGDRGVTLNLRETLMNKTDTVTIPVSDYGPFEDSCAAVLHMVSEGLRSLSA